MGTLDISAETANVVFEAGDYGYGFTCTATAVSGLTVTAALTADDGTTVALTVANSGSGTSYVLAVTLTTGSAALPPGEYAYEIIGTKTGVRYTFLTGRAVIR